MTGLLAIVTAPLFGAGDPVYKTFAEWRSAVQARGGIITRYPSGIHKGAPAARYNDPATGAYRLELAPANIRNLDWNVEMELSAEMHGGVWARLISPVAETVVEVAAAANPVNLASKGLGIPRPVIVAVALVGLYAVGVQAGLFPPLRRVFGK